MVLLVNGGQAGNGGSEPQPWGTISQGKSRLQKDEIPLFSCFNTGLCSVILVRGGPPQNPHIGLRG